VICLMVVSEAPDWPQRPVQKPGEADRGRSHIPIGKARKADDAAAREV